MSGSASPPPKLSLRTRFHAWWEGYDAKPPEPEGHPEKGDAAKRQSETAAGRGPGLDRHGKPLWTATRVEVAETLWGKGFNAPGGEEHALYLARPLGLNPAMSVLELGAGLGGLCQALVKKFGCWATGLEASPLLAKIGMERSTAADMVKRAPILAYDPENFAYEKRVDVVIMRDALFLVAKKEQFFDGLLSRLKPRGQVLMTDYVIDPKANLSKLEGWAANEPQEPHLWTLRDAEAAFTQRNLDLRIAEDVTDAHRALILAGLNAFTIHLAQVSMNAETKAHVLSEIEIWARRVQAFGCGLRAYRFYAINPNTEG